MKNIKLAEFIIHNEIFYKNLSKAEQKIISDLDWYNNELSILHKTTRFNKNGSIIEKDFNEGMIIIFIGIKANKEYYYRVECKLGYLYMAYGHIIILDKNTIPFNINKYKINE